MRFSTEQKIAGDLLLQGAAISTPLLSKFSAWLMAGLGAAFTLFLTNIDSVAKFFSSYSIRWALYWFTASLLLGMLARLLSVSVMSGLASNERIAKQLGDAIGSAERFVFPAFINRLLSGLLLPYRCIAWRTFKIAMRGDLMASAKFTAKTSQTQALLVFGQIVCATASIIALASGVKV
ncbi:hypothetical protein [Lysobacter terrae]